MMKNKFIAILVSLALTALPASAQGPMTKAFGKITDSLSVLLQEHTSVKVDLKIKNVEKRGSALDFYFTASLGDVPWHSGDPAWFRKVLGDLAPDQYKKFSIGKITTNNIQLEDLITPTLGNDGMPEHTKYLLKSHKASQPVVRRAGARNFGKGLSGRTLAVWQSHGRYYNDVTDKWTWQRPRLFTTCEDMYTQSYVIPFLIPMLENAGAYVITPRERDTQTGEAICDNDPSFEGPRDTVRRSGTYEESGKWDDGGIGFGDKRRAYVRNENPFTMGTYRMTDSHSAMATWTPDIPHRGRYAVYVSYASLPHSTTEARYTVSHLGGDTEFIVDQKVGGGTWVYLGTFEFEEGSKGKVSLEGPSESGKIVTADAVRFGGGMGKIARGPKDTPVEEWKTSGMPAYMEGALYSMQWSGIDSTVLRGFDREYTNDFARRGAWVVDMKKRGIASDLSLAFHSDAGVTPNDSTVGTLSIYTLKADNGRTYPDGGGDRMAARELCDLVQSQVVGDIRAQYDTAWSRRQIWDRSYSECRTTEVPGMILELLSHQNMADMRYGLDPAFRFSVSRAVYKGILKFLSNRYGVPYQVQPLPVREFSVTFAAGDIAKLSWTQTYDDLEPTAAADGYILQTRIDNGAFDEGRIVETTEGADGRVSCEVPVPRGHIYSFRIVAFNDGGRSFPSEILSAGSPRKLSDKSPVLIVNNFTRVSGPAWIDTPTYAGLDPKVDAGVPWGEDITYMGDQYQYRRTQMGCDTLLQEDFGASYEDLAGRKQIGNTFDYPYIHGQAILSAGRSFCSAGADAFAADSSLTKGIGAVDIICGKQVTTSMGSGSVPDRYRVYSYPLRVRLKEFTEGGGNVLVSGAYIGTDVWDQIYPVRVSPAVRTAEKTFAKDVLGYSWKTNFGSRTGEIAVVRTRGIGLYRHCKKFSVCNRQWGPVYRVENPDGLMPATRKDKAFLHYADTEIPAAICHDGKTYKAVSMGFPFETMDSAQAREQLMESVLDYFGN